MLEATTEVLYDPAAVQVLDLLTAEGLTQFTRETPAQVLARCPGAERITLAQAVARMDAKWRKPVSEITRDRYWDMLECLPPVAWNRNGSDESFKMSERTSGNITAIFCRLGDSYYTLEDDMRTPHAEIVRRCRAFAVAQVQAGLFA